MKKGISLPVTIVERDGKLFVRKAHNAGNEHLHRINDCMKQKLTGQRGGGMDAQRARFRQARAQCQGA